MKKNVLFIFGFALFLILFVCCLPGYPKFGFLCLVFAWVLGAGLSMWIFRSDRFLVKKLSLLFFSLAVGLVFVFSVDVFLFMRRPASEVDIPPHYFPFAKKYAHPFFYFSFPQKESVLKKINNSVCSVDSDGFRGSNPREKGARKLAFVVGGSSVFGYGNSSNESTISAYLNKKQSEYYFVNAGVPSWVSVQEFYRVAIQLIDYKPDLIVVYDGFNDGICAYYVDRLGGGYPPGTIEDYWNFEKAVDLIREGGAVRVDLGMLLRNTLPFRDFLQFVRRTLGRGPREGASLTKLMKPELTDGPARRYLQNLELMRKVAFSSGIDTKFYFQPMLVSHAHVSKTVFNKIIADRDQMEFLRAYCESVKRISADMKFPLRDASSFFDGKLKQGSVDQFFSDQVHLTDLGNELIADRIRTDL